MKKLIIFLFFSSIILFTLVFHKVVKSNNIKFEIIFALDSEYMYVNGMKKEIDPGRGTKPILIKEWGRVVLPIRSIIETLEGEVSWFQNERKVVISLDENILELWIDNPKAKVNGSLKWIDEGNTNVKPLIINGRTMLPIRFVVENLGCKVEWIDKEKKVIINYSKRFILNNNEINLNIKEDKGVYKLIIKNPLNEKTKINLSLNYINKPKSWFSEFCIDIVCYFNNAEIELNPHEKKEVEIYFYIQEKGFGEFIFCLKYLDYMECIKFNIFGG